MNITSSDLKETWKACTSRWPNQNRNFLQVNRNCSAQDLLAILQDYYDQFAPVEEPTFGVKTHNFQASPFLFKRKKKKVASESPHRSPNEKQGSQNKYFAIFAQPIDGHEELLRQLDDINKICEREVNKNLREVLLLVQPLH